MAHEYYDITGEIGPLFPRTDQPAIPMYSYDRPAYMVWGAIANALHARGWTEAQIKEWLQSKDTRWALDGNLGDALRDAAVKYAATIPDTAKTR